MKTLYLLRHAKSSWDDRTLADIDRPLNNRGKRTAPFMGELMLSNGFKPDVVFCSPATRARETAELVLAAANIELPIHFVHKIYEASPQTLNEVVAKIAGAHSSALLVGHNPGIEGFIRFLTGEVEIVPTAALAVIDLDIHDWDSADDGSGVLRAIYRPRDEMA